MSEEIKEENNVSLKLERKIVLFDLRTDIHQELKLQSVIQDKNIYILIEEALSLFFKPVRKSTLLRTTLNYSYLIVSIVRKTIN